MCTIGHTEAAIGLQNRVSNRHTFLAGLACRSLHRTVFRVRAFGGRFMRRFLPNTKFLLLSVLPASSHTVDAGTQYVASGDVRWKG
jgi:hypothetical protein